MKLVTRFSLFILLLLQMLVLHAKVVPNSLFSDHMILQKGKPVPVWGTANDGEKITVSFNEQTVSAICKKGKWMIKLAELPYITSPTNMNITGTDTLITIHDILVGEVWICSGQSNMERQLGPRPPQPLITDWEKERDEANYPAIREYYVPLNYSEIKVDDVKNKWTVCSPQTVADFTAVGYFFAKDLYNKLHVPVGIIFSAFGGTPAEDWTSKEALMANPALTDFVNNYKKTVAASYQPAGQLMSGLYSGMVYPLIPYAFNGVAWYQGEANNDRTEQYPTVLTNMIQNWRTDFQQGDFPFLIVQIAPHKDMRPELREAQLIVTEKVKNTALIVTTDCGDSDNIHPSFKQPVGERLAIAAMALSYGAKTEFEGPFYHFYKIKRNKIIIQFTHKGSGLRSKDDLTLQGFTISGADNKFIPAVAIIKKNKVIVYNKLIQKPIAVRYGWSNVPHVNLYNKEGLPASPFRTDNN